MEPVFKLTPSFICSLIRQSSSLKSEADIMTAFDKLADLKEKTLRKEHANVITDGKKRRELLLEDVPDKLRPLAEALYGFVSVESDGGEESAGDEPEFAFSPELIRGEKAKDAST